VYTACSTTAHGCCTVEVHAPFTIINACPCDLLCQLNPPVGRTELGKEKDYFSMSGSTIPELFIQDGKGGAVRVSPRDPVIEIFPLRLDHDGYFYWLCNGRRERTRPRWPNTNCVHAEMNVKRGQVTWRCFHVTLSRGGQLLDASATLRIGPQSVLPVFDTVAEDLRVSFALPSASCSTSWSLPIQAVSRSRSLEDVIELEYKGIYIRLNVNRKGRELAIYARHWFVNSTGLKVNLLQSSDGPGPMQSVPCFGAKKIAFLPEIRNESGDGVAFVQLRGSKFAQQVLVPDVGGSQELQLTDIHPCCLCTEQVALPEAMQHVCCRLVSLLPALLMFHRADGDLELGVRQAGATDGAAVWVKPGACTAFWWLDAERPKLVQISVRITAGEAAGRKLGWSGPFALKETHIGAYPVALTTGYGLRRLVCVCIDQEASTLALTIRGSDCCHTLVNKHPTIACSARMEGTNDDPNFIFPVPFDTITALGGKGPPREGDRSRVRLTLHSISDKTKRAVAVVDLGRTGTYRVYPNRVNSTLAEQVDYAVELRNRVAVITVKPGDTVLDEEGQDAGRQTLSCELSVGLLSVALVTEGIASSSFTASSSAVNINALVISGSDPGAVPGVSTKHPSFGDHGDEIGSTNV